MLCTLHFPIQHNQLIHQKLNEREEQEHSFKPSKNMIATSNPSDFKEYNDLKTESNKYEQKTIKKNDNFNNIMTDLQKLGIIN